MQPGKPNIKALRLYVSYWRQFPSLTAGCLLFSLTMALQATIVPLIVSLVLGQLIREHTVNVGLLVFAGIFQLIAVALSYLTDDRAVAILHHKVEEKLYQDSFSYLTRQDYSFFANRFSGSIVTQASRFAKVYSAFHDLIFFDIVPLFATVLIAVGIMIHYLPLLGLAILIIWAILIWIVGVLAINRMPMRRAAVAKESEQIGELADMVTNSTAVKTFAAEDREISRYQIINAHRGGYFLRSWHRAVRNGWLMEALCIGLQLLVFIGGILAVQHNRLSIAAFLLFQVYSFRIIDSVRRSGFIARNLEVVSGDAQEMAELLEQPPLVQDKPGAQKSRIKRGAITFEAVGFQYKDANQQETLFENFDMTIGAGEKVGLVGPSGGGKTTITRLLLRFMDIQSGGIKIDGQDIRDIKQQELRRAIAYVPQDPLLFHRSIKENIRYGRPKASDDEIIAVAKKAYAHDFIKDLPQGYDTLVGERGVKLSGGQRQRVAIARAMLTEAPILILDEATSALDSESEKLIQKALWELMKDKTAVVIAHRLSTIHHLDRIIVLDDGRIIEQGSHQALLKAKGLYARLWSHQSGGFIYEE